MSSNSPVLDLANHIGCDTWALIPMLTRLMTAKEAREVTAKLEELERALARFQWLLGVTEGEEAREILKEFVRQTEAQIERQLEIRTLHPTGHKRNPEAHVIAEEIAKVFIDLGRDVGYSNPSIDKDGNEITVGDYCRAVEFGMKAFGISGDYKSAAKATAQKAKSPEFQIWDH